MADLKNTIVRGILRVLEKIETQEASIGSGGTGSTDSINSPLFRVKGGRIKIENFGKYLELGPSNASFAHFTTDATFYFNNNIQVAGYLSPYENNTYSLGSSSTKWKEVHATTIYENGTTIDTIMDNKIQAAIGDAIAASY